MEFYPNASLRNLKDERIIRPIAKGIMIFAEFLIVVAVFALILFGMVVAH